MNGFGEKILKDLDAAGYTVAVGGSGNCVTFFPIGQFCSVIITILCIYSSNTNVEKRGENEAS